MAADLAQKTNTTVPTGRDSSETQGPALALKRLGDLEVQVSGKARIGLIRGSAESRCKLRSYETLRSLDATL